MHDRLINFLMNLSPFLVRAGEPGDRKFRRNITVKLLSCARDQRGTYARNRGRIYKSEIKKNRIE